jgi:2-methylisocitrate lyase-like PEP mutase family enzyme
MTSQQTPAVDAVEALRELHRQGMLVLPNAWDAVSARAFERVGFPAVATTSGGVALCLGYADQERTPDEEMFSAVGRIARAVGVPVTADLEGGYGLPSEGLAERAIGTGICGCNLEDTDHGRRDGERVPVTTQARRLATFVAACRRLGRPLVLNARVDAFLDRSLPLGDQVGEAVQRGRAYLDAGADCVYPISTAVLSEETVAELVEGIGGPVNILYRPGGPALDRLEALGVRRVSFGTSLHRVVAARVDEIASGLRRRDTSVLGR